MSNSRAAKQTNGKGRKRPTFNKPIKLSAREDTEAKKLNQLYNRVESSEVKTFRDLPLSSKTKKGLEEAGYVEPTEIQRESILLALRGLDVLGAAKTGSGKTLAFILPVLERLFAAKWSKYDGLGALVITPTRELAFQIFETLRKVGKHHDFSAGLVIGGKDLAYESKRLATCNIVICTPGRLLHHMDENPQFHASNLQILILDEADRCLDMGFCETMNAILQNLPTKRVGGRQTLLYSATQTRSVKDLARLGLVDPVYVSVHEHSSSSTPDRLQQSYLVCQLHEKINTLWSFVRSHKRQKILVFMQSCKQVKYVGELFKRLRCGMAVTSLYGTLHQLRRMAIYREFCQSQQAVLFATDIAARGLDFPAVDWVLQLDCPEDATTYLHRVGRTARHSAVGQSLLVLLPSEEPAMLRQLTAYKIPIDKIEVNPKKMSDIQRKIQAHLASDHLLKESAKRAFQAYLKSTFLLKNKAVFDVTKLDTESFALSLGLGIPPRVRFLQRHLKKNAAQLVGESDDDDDEEEEEAALLTVKRKDHEIATGEGEEEEEQTDFVPQDKIKVVTKAAAVKKMLKKKNIHHNQVLKFDDDGEGVDVEATKAKKFSKEAKDYELEQEEGRGGGIDLEKAKTVMRAEDKFDRQMEREKLKERKKEEKRKLKELRMIRRDECDDDGEDDSDADVRLNTDRSDSDPQEDTDEEEDDHNDANCNSAKRKWKAPRKPKQQTIGKRQKMEEEEDKGTEDLANVEDLAIRLMRGQ